MDIGEKLFELRKGKNLSQEEVAEKLNVTRQTVSKWETNQSTPDFDKIIPICELFEITTEELLTGKKPEEKVEEEAEVKKEDVEEERPLTKQEVKRKSAEVVSTSVFLYILAVVFIMITIPVLRMNPIIASSIFLVIVGLATVRIIRHYMSIPKFEKTKEEKKEEKILKQIDSMIGTITAVIYFIVSFTTFAWHITWIIFIIGGIVSKIVELVFMLKEDEEDEV